jgi:hypothetical protein
MRHGPSPIGILAAGCVAVALPACDPQEGGAPGPSGAGASAFGEVFERASTIELQESGEDFIAMMHEVSVSPSGDTLAFLDPMMHRLRLHDRDGVTLATRGGPDPGDGPGEFNTPLALEWDASGALWVSEQANPRMTRLRSNLSLDTIVTFPDGQIITGMHRARDGRILLRVRSREIVAFDTDSLTVAPFKDPHPRAFEPYWVQYGGQVADASESWIASAFSMEYPIEVHRSSSGSVARVIEEPPPSWRQARVPAVGEFAIGPGAGTGSNPVEWRRSFTRIAGLHLLGENCLLAVHEVPDLTEHAMLQIDFLADLHHLPSGRLLMQDQELPGRLMGGDRSSLMFLVRAPPEPWTLEAWTLGGAAAAECQARGAQG